MQPPPIGGYEVEFQFLSRNSVRWDHIQFENDATSNRVSIPQSEFCPLGPDHLYGDSHEISMFQFLSRNSVRWDHNRARRKTAHRPRFQFLSRNSVRWDMAISAPAQLAILRFNSSVGILSVGTNHSQSNPQEAYDVSIPQSEFCPLGRRHRTRRR